MFYWAPSVAGRYWFRIQIHPCYSLVETLPLPWTCSFFFFFFGGTQHSPFNGHSTTRCNFGAITGKDEFTPFYFAIFTSSQEQTRKGGNAYIPLLHFLHLSALSDRLESHWQSQGHLFSSRMPVLSQCRTLCYHVISLTWWYYLWHVNRECASWWADPRQHYPRAFL